MLNREENIQLLFATEFLNHLKIYNSSKDYMISAKLSYILFPEESTEEDAKAIIEDLLTSLKTTEFKEKIYPHLNAGQQKTFLTFFEFQKINCYSMVDFPDSKESVEVLDKSFTEQKSELLPHLQNPSKPLVNLPRFR